MALVGLIACSVASKFGSREGCEEHEQAMTAKPLCYLAEEEASLDPLFS
jgi:hypothetical protein